jgi:predicted ATPase with chaperone activity
LLDRIDMHVEVPAGGGEGVDAGVRVARTIADLAGVGEIALEYVAEAVQYQGLDRTRESG